MRPCFAGGGFAASENSLSLDILFFSAGRENRSLKTLDFSRLK